MISRFKVEFANHEATQPNSVVVLIISVSIKLITKGIQILKIIILNMKLYSFNQVLKARQTLANIFVFLS